MCVTPNIITKDKADSQKPTVADGTDLREAVEIDGAAYKEKYMAYAQSMFSRVQHHIHKKTKKGYLPLKSCQRKTKRSGTICKADFPKQHRFGCSYIVCQGLAKKLKIAITGKRNMFGAHLGKRRCQWQSGTTPSFAVGFASNSHTMPNWRLPAMSETHSDDLCKSRKCRNQIGEARFLKVVSKLAQRVQRQCTGYYCGYTFKPQPIGSKFVRLASQSLNYLEEGLKEKTWGQRWHRVTHRMLVDHNHRCMRRTAYEEWNLASGLADHDVR